MDFIPIGLSAFQCRDSMTFGDPLDDRMPIGVDPQDGWIPLNVPHSEAIATVDLDYTHSNSDSMDIAPHSDSDGDSDCDSEGAQLTYRIMAGTQCQVVIPSMQVGRLQFPQSQYTREIVSCR